MKSDEIGVMESCPDIPQDSGECSVCGWSGKLSDAVKEEEGNYQSGYYTAVFCPECEDGGCIENFYPSEEAHQKWREENEVSAT